MALDSRPRLFSVSLESGSRRCFWSGLRLLFIRGLFLSGGLIVRGLCFFLFGLGLRSRFLGGSGRGRLLLQDA